MNKRTTETPATPPRLMDINGLMNYTSLGRKSAERLAAEAGAIKRIGKRKLYDRELIDDHINVMM